MILNELIIGGISVMLQYIYKTLTLPSVYMTLTSKRVVCDYASAVYQYVDTAQIVVCPLERRHYVFLPPDVTTYCVHLRCCRFAVFEIRR